MAIEQYTIIYDIEPIGKAPASWKEKEVVVQGKEKNIGKGGSGLKTNVPSQGYFVTIEAESVEEAAQALRSFYGAGTCNGKVLGALTSNLEEKAAN